MTDPRYASAAFSEWEVVPGWFIGGQAQQARNVLVRCFADSADGGQLRLTAEDGKGLSVQLVVRADDLRKIVGDPQQIDT